MSWSATATSLKADEIDKVPEPSWESFADQDHVPAMKEQFDVAVKAAALIAESGAVGSSNKVFNVLLSGHGNPDHEPTGSWVNDCVTVSVNQA